MNLCVLLTMLSLPFSLSASGKPGCCSHHEQTTVSISEWTFDLDPAAGHGSTVTVTHLTELLQHCNSSSVAAILLNNGSQLTVWTDTENCLPADATCDLALVEVFDAAGTLVGTWSVEAVGGEVIVVLIED